MIKSFKSNALADLCERGTCAGINKSFHARIKRRLAALDAATKPSDMRFPGWDFHPLSGFNPTRYSVHVNGPWCLTFEFDGTDVCKVDFEQYH